MNINRNSKLKNILFGTQKVSELVPGFLLALALMLVSFFLSDLFGKIIPFKNNPLSPMLAAIIIGLAIRNLVKLPKLFEAGISFGIKKLLRLGIILMGIRLSILSVLEIGAVAIGMVIICITVALVITIALSERIKISSKLGALIAGGTSICGVSAIVALSPTIEADEEETAYSIGVITLFGILATIFYPYLVELVLNLNVAQAGFFLGTSVHETAQVTAAALIYDDAWGLVTSKGFTGADIAITTKLVRNTFMLVVIPILGYYFNKKKTGGQKLKKFNITRYIPFFIMGYIVFGVIRTMGDYIFGTDHEVWKSAWNLMLMLF